MTLAAHGASRYSVAAFLTRPPRRTCSLRFRIEFALRLYHSNRAVAREYQKNIKAFAKISDNRVKFVAFSIRSCYNSFRTWGYSSVGRALASHVRGQGFDSPYLHHLPKDPNIRVFFLLSRADGEDKGSAPLMTRFSRQSGCTRLRLDTFVSRRTLTAIAVRRLPFNMVSPSAQRSEYSGLFFLSRADGEDKGSAPPTTRFSRQSGCTRLRLDTFVSRHSLTAIAVRRLPQSFPNGNRCKATPPLIWFHHLPKDPIVRVFFLSSRADGGDKGSAALMTCFSRQSGCTPLCSALALRRGRTHVLGGSPSGSVADARSRAL